jgi:hypothetical protein
MGTRVAQDLRGRDPAYDDRSWGEWAKSIALDPDSFIRSPIKRTAAGVAGWLGDWSENYRGYGSEQEHAMHEQSGLSTLSPTFGIINALREPLYNLTGGKYDVGGQLQDIAALGLNIPTELFRFGKAGLEGLLPQHLKHGWGKGTGYGFDYLSQAVLGTPDMWEDNPLRFQHPGWNEEGTKYEFHESYAPHMDKAMNEYLDDLMTKRAEEDIDKRTSDLVDWDTFFYENPDATEQDYKRAWSDAKNDLIFEKYGDQALDYADKNYKKEMMDEYGLYNPALLQGLEPGELEEAMGDMASGMEFGILDPLKDYYKEMDNPWWSYSSPEAQEKLIPIQRMGEAIGGFGIPAAMRAALRTGVKYGMPKAMERTIKEAFPGTAQLFGRGEAGIPKGLGIKSLAANDIWWKKFINRGLIAPVNAARPWGGQFATVGTIAEMMDED